LELFPIWWSRITALSSSIPPRRKSSPWPVHRPRFFVARLRELGVTPLSVGRTIVATWEPNEKIVLDVIHELALELHIIFNKGAVMVLPVISTRRGGLKRALKVLEIHFADQVG
jgi:hypothetical protein